MKDRILYVRDSRSKSKSPGSLGYAKRKHTDSILQNKDKSEYGYIIQY